MRDISSLLRDTMQNEKCSPLYALFILSETGVNNDGIYKFQSKPSEKTGRRLRHSGNIQNVR